MCSLEVKQLLQAKADLEKELERAREGEEERREREEALRYVTRVRAGERSQASLHSYHHCSPPWHLSLAAGGSLERPHLPAVFPWFSVTRLGNNLWVLSRACPLASWPPPRGILCSGCASTCRFPTSHHTGLWSEPPWCGPHPQEGPPVPSK